MKVSQKIYGNIVNVLVWLISLGLSSVFIQYGWPKFDPEGFWTAAFTERWGYGLWFMYLIGFLEIVGAVAILIPRLASYGGFLLAIIMVGALTTRLIHGVSLTDAVSIVNFMITALFIAAYWIKHFDFIKVANSK